MSAPRGRPAEPIRAPRGAAISCKGWAQEAALRMLMNNLDPDVAERWEDLVVYGGSGKAARSWEAHHTIGGTLAGRLVLSGGLGGMGGAQPLAVTLNEGVGLFVEVDRGRIERRLRLRYVDRMTASIDEALGWAEEARAKRTPLSIAVHGNAAEVHPELASRGVRFDVVTDQTSAHDMLNGYVPAGLSVEAAAELRARDPEAYLARAYASLAEHMRAMLELQKRGAILFDYGNNVRREAENAGVTDFAYPGFVPAFIRPLFCEGQGPFRWVALSGDPEDIYATDGALIDAFRDNTHLVRWLRLAHERVHFQGLPARICWLGYGDRVRAGRIFNDLVASGRVKAPVAIGRDHLDSGSVASPYRETELMRDGSDAIADWPILNALLNVAAGATWVSVHHGGGVGIGNSIHAGMVVVADGTDDA